MVSPLGGTRPDPIVASYRSISSWISSRMAVDGSRSIFDIISIRIIKSISSGLFLVISWSPGLFPDGFPSFLDIGFIAFVPCNHLV